MKRGATIVQTVIVTATVFLSILDAATSFPLLPRASKGTLVKGVVKPVVNNQRHRDHFSQQTPSRIWAGAKEDNEEDDDGLDPLSDGVDSVGWLPTVEGKKGDPSQADGGESVIPLFPLGGIVYTPNSEHVLNIFEPRYRKMYTDILMNGSKRFAVCMAHPSESGRFAEIGVLFELEDLKEVSEMTGDRIKYICNHKVTGRARLHKILNPEAWQKRDTYLKATCTIIDDSEKEGSTTEEEDEAQQLKLCDAFSELVQLQHELEEDVRFTKASVSNLPAKPGAGKDGLWQTIKLWQSFADQRLMARQNELQRDFQEKLQEYLKKEKGLKGEELPSAVGFQDLSPELQKEVVDLQKRMTMELQPLVLESTLTMQKILECSSHTERLVLLRSFVTAETRRLSTKKTLFSMFSGTTSSKLTEIPEISTKRDSSSFFADEDAFQ